MGQLREEKRAAKMLRSQLAEERGFVADTVLAKLGLPRVRSPDRKKNNQPKLLKGCLLLTYWRV